jgi:hypothetical protein
MRQRARGSQSKGRKTRVNGADNGSPLSSVIGSYSPGREKEVSLERS